MDVIFRILFLVSFISFTICGTSACIHFFKAHAALWILRQKDRCSVAAELVDINLSGRACFLGALAGPVTFWVFSLIRKRRLKNINSQLPDLLALLGNALKAGLSLSQAIEMASLELPPPMGPELVRIASSLKMGVVLEAALQKFSERLPSEDVYLIVQSIEILRRSGGNLVETFSTLAETIESRCHVESRIQVLTAQGVYQAIMLIAMPWVLALVLYLISPEYLNPLITTRLGALFIAVGVSLEILGALWLKKIVVIKV